VDRPLPRAVGGEEGAVDVEQDQPPHFPSPPVVRIPLLQRRERPRCVLTEAVRRPGDSPAGSV
jgi:hypothetical protein